MRRLPLAIFAALPVTLALPATLAAQNRPADAASVVTRYYQAIDRGDFRTAYRSWGGNGTASGKSYAAFVRGFAQTAHAYVVLGHPGRAEGAAGSTFVEIPVDVRATLKNGRAQHFRGSYVVRRVNDVPGATPAQRRWHLASAKLRAA